MSASKQCRGRSVSSCLPALVGIAGLAVTPAAEALDLDWSETTGLLTYNTPDHWTPNSGAGGPTDSDNLTFSILIAPTPQILLGATNQGDDFNIDDNAWTFTSAGGSTLDTEGTVTVNDEFAAGLGDGSFLTVDAAVNWDNALDLVVGDTGYGTFTLEADSDFRGLNVRIGSQLGSVGVVNVDGTGTLLQTDGDDANFGFFIGDAGTGTLNVTNGAIARIVNDVSGSIADFELGIAASGDGTLNIDGAGSQVIAEDVYIGREGTGTVTITNGSVMNQNIGDSADAIVAMDGGPGSVTVNDGGSQWLMRRLDVGRSGVGTLSVENGALVRAIEASNGNNGDVIIGTLAAGVDPVADPLGDGSVAVFGTGSTLDVDDNLIVGDIGKGTLRVGQNLAGTPDGAGTLLVDVNLVVGDDNTNVSTNLVVVDGASVTANVGNRTVVGNEANGTLDVLGGAQFDTAFLRVAEVAGSDGTLTVSGTNTELQATGDTVIGTRGTAVATVSDGAVLRNDTLWVGFDDNGGGTLTVDNATVVAGDDNAGNLIIGGELPQNGGTGTVTVQNGGTLSALDEVYIGGNANGDGTLIVTGLGSLFDNDDNAAGVVPNDLLRIGYDGRGVAEVRDGGRIEAEGVIIGSRASSDEASLLVTGTSTVDGTPSTVVSSGYLYVGDGRPGTMTIEQGAKVQVATDPDDPANRRIFIGDDNAADGSKLTITGTGSRLDYFNTGDISVGNAGGSTTNRAELEVLSGGVFSAVQRNPDQTVASSARIIIGDADNGNGLVTVDGDGSLVEARVIYVGDGTNNSSGVLDIKNGAVATTLDEVEIASNGNATGTVLVTGPGSRLEVGTFLSLGNDQPNNGSATGTLFVSDGGAVTTAGSAYVGHLTGATGNATISSATSDTSTWDVAGDMVIAGTDTSSQLSGSGSLGVLTGGRVTVDGALRIRNLGSVALNGGEIRADSLQFVDAGADLTWVNGTLRFTNSVGTTLDASLLSDIFSNGPQVLNTGKHLAVDGTAVLGGPVRVNGGTLSIGNISAGNFANVDFDAGTLNLTNTGLVVTDAGLFGDTLTVGADQTINVATNLFVQGDGLLTVSRGDISALGGVNNGTAVIAEGTATFTNGLTNNDELVLIDATLNGGLTNNGDLTVIGTSALSALSLGSGGSAGFEIASLVGAPNLLDVSGTASIDGTLTVTADDPNGLTAGSEFALITADGGVTGTFGSVSLPTLSPGLGFDLLYETNRVALAVVTLGEILGDYNDSGLVEQGDLDQVLANWGAGFATIPGTWINQRPTEGIVDQAELDVVLTNWGSSSAPDFAGSAVPEPGTLALLSLGALAGRRRRA